MEQQKESESSIVSRRNVVLALGGTAAVAGALMAAPLRNPVTQPSRGVPAPGPGGRPVSLATAGYDLWSQQVGSIFTIAGSNTMQLTGVRAMPAGGTRPPSLGRDMAFVAVFDPLNGATMAGDLTYGASHPQHGALMMFLTASSDPRAPARMFAVFN